MLPSCAVTFAILATNSRLLSIEITDEEDCIDKTFSPIESSLS